MTKLTIAYSTARKEPMIEWFFQSLAIQCGGDFSAIKIVVVDYWANPFGGTKQEHEARRAYMEERIDAASIPRESVDWMSPKSNPWQGKQRQTREDYFNVANARNTAICFADGEWIAFVDDLSVLQPNWLNMVAQAMMAPKTITVGRYKKVRELEVTNGEVVHHILSTVTDEKGVVHEVGADAREKRTKDLTKPRPAQPDEHFGYTVGPIEAYLAVNGWCETLCAGLSFEDVPTGIALAKKGYAIRYDPRMVVWESEERHGLEAGMRRADYKAEKALPEFRQYADKSHAVLALARQGNGYFKNDFFNGMTLVELRNHVHAQASNGFPSPKSNMREWYTGFLLSELVYGVT